tara:strand:+ start:889 stop:1065 length:177 start_codon:yes stop_codon:yes gene_type:complete
MNEIKKHTKEAYSNKKIDKVSLENKVIEQLLDSSANLDLIDNSNAFYSERYGWTLRQN